MRRLANISPYMCDMYIQIYALCHKVLTAMHSYVTKNLEPQNTTFLVKLSGSNYTKAGISLNLHKSFIYGGLCVGLVGHMPCRNRPLNTPFANRLFRNDLHWLS